VLYQLSYSHQSGCIIPSLPQMARLECRRNRGADRATALSNTSRAGFEHGFLSRRCPLGTGWCYNVGGSMRLGPLRAGSGESTKKEANCGHLRPTARAGEPGEFDLRNRNRLCGHALSPSVRLCRVEIDQYPGWQPLAAGRRNGHNLLTCLTAVRF
jgi:hypothetical protein